VIDAVEEMGELDNTLVIYIYGDNGASMEGTLTGSFNELTMQNGIPLTPEQQLALISSTAGWMCGAPTGRPALRGGLGLGRELPVPVGQAGRLPPGRHPAGHGIRYPRLITDAGGLRSQFTHCIDIGPTILDWPACRSRRTSTGSPRADARHQLPAHLRRPGRRGAHTQQYFEIYGYRAMYKDGWWLAQSISRIPWDLTPETMRGSRPGCGSPTMTRWSCTTCR
jgi:Arylsulfatase A and related enzymes